MTEAKQTQLLSPTPPKPIPPPANLGAPAEKPAPDTALVAAWRRFLDYDKISSDQKRTYVRIRSWVIVLVLLTSAFAVFSIYEPFVGLAGLLRLLLIVMPITGVALINYASQFASSTAWVEYRVSAEVIRSEIYLYRAQVGEYAGKSLYERQQLLLQKVDEADNRMSQQNAALPYMQPVDDEKIGAQIQAKTQVKDDDGLSAISPEKYIEWRAEPQMNWYIDKIRDDYRNMRRSSLMALLVGAAGSAISALLPEHTGLVAVTTAMGVALAQYSGVRMYGATYGVFHNSASKIQNTLNLWEIRPKDMRTAQAAANIVTDVEGVLKHEREQWSIQALEAQSSSEQNIYQNLAATGEVKATQEMRAAGQTPTEGNNSAGEIQPEK
jgi:hypothetical protein